MKSWLNRILAVKGSTKVFESFLWFLIPIKVTCYSITLRVSTHTIYPFNLHLLLVKTKIQKRVSLHQLDNRLHVVIVYTWRTDSANSDTRDYSCRRQGINLSRRVPVGDELAKVILDGQGCGWCKLNSCEETISTQYFLTWRVCRRNLNFLKALLGIKTGTPFTVPRIQNLPLPPFKEH